MYGIVRSAISKQSGIGYAAKFLRRRRRGQCCLNEINHEIAVLMLCADSDHVVKLESVHETRSEVALILELATGGELQTLIDEQGQLSEQKTRVCMREILKALQHMHSKSIAHLDLKPQNILLAGKTVDDGLKLCDFGIARFIGEKNKIYEIVGTPDYVAPEVLHYDPLSLQTDIWSIGVVAYVLLTGLSPFGGDSKQETFLNVTKCSLTFPDDLFDGISNDAIDFIKSALRIKPNDDEESHNDADHDGRNGVVSTSSSSPPPPPVCLQSHYQQQQKSASVVETVVPADSTVQDAKEELLEQEEKGQEKEEEEEAEEDNKENVMVVTCTLFPDAPTTPKVSRKTLPVEPLNDGGGHHHYHHHHNHNLHHTAGGGGIGANGESCINGADGDNADDNALLVAPSAATVTQSADGDSSTCVSRRESDKTSCSPAATVASASSTATSAASCTFAVVGSGCRTTVATTMALCGLKCTESPVNGASNRHLATAGSRKTLSQCDKDAIIC
uniref:non-specific serine/threonine protein kinase n=1 Tax=Anopheles dirus TaxID=7168 RepID=A0A182MZS2_9DIPT